MWDLRGAVGDTDADTKVPGHLSLVDVAITTTDSRRLYPSKGLLPSKVTVLDPGSKFDASNFTMWSAFAVGNHNQFVEFFVPVSPAEGPVTVTADVVAPVRQILLGVVGAVPATVRGDPVSPV